MSKIQKLENNMEPKHIRELKIFENIKNNAEFDVCILGNGISPFWTYLALAKKNYRVLWIHHDPIISSERSFFQNANNWEVSEDRMVQLANLVDCPFDINHPESVSFGTVYYDAKHSKRLRSLAEVKPEYAPHEMDYYSCLNSNAVNMVNAWAWHQKCVNEHENLEFNNSFELQQTSIIEINIEKDSICSVDLGLFINGKKISTQIKAKAFVISENDSSFSEFILNEEHARKYLRANKGLHPIPGFGVKYEHKSFDAIIQQNVIVPMLVNPTKKEDQSHVLGRFNLDKKSSTWFGFLTQSELEDNHEILKKMKSLKRILDRTFAGFADSVTRESYTFEEKLWIHQEKPQLIKVFESFITRDHSGLNQTIDHINSIVLQILDQVQTTDKINQFASTEVQYSVKPSELLPE